MKVRQLKFGFNSETFEYGLGEQAGTSLWATDINVEIDLSAMTVTLTMYPEDTRAGLKAYESKKAHLMLEYRTAVGEYTGDPNAGGWDSVQHMTPTHESWLAHFNANEAEWHRLVTLKGTTLVHVYQLWQIKGRIEALKE